MSFIHKPLVINLPVTEICDSQCTMCNVWTAGKTDEFNKESIRSIFNQEAFDKVKHIGLSGGEPTLNPNLLDIVDELIVCLPKLLSLSITSHGYHTDKHALLLPLIKEKCNSKGINFSLNISLDGFENAHVKIRRIMGAFEKATNTAKFAKNLGIHVQFQCTISPQNVFNIVLVREYAINSGFEIIFRIASYIARLSNENLKERIALNNQQKSFVSDFLISDRTLFAAKSLSRRLFYFDLAKRLNTGAKRTAPCAFQFKGLFVSPDTKIYNCSRSENEFLFTNKKNIQPELNSQNNKRNIENFVSKTCPDCYHDQTGRWPLWKYFTVHNKIYPHLKRAEKLSKIPGILSKLLYIPKKIEPRTTQFNRVLVIGMYGGEHVGDAAILGGVILRAMQKYNCNYFDVLSFRPNRTRYWVSNINIPDVYIEVVSRDAINFKKYDAVILGGGPLMGIPSILSNHIEILKGTKRNNIPFFIEGVGIGPINDSVSKKLIKKIINSANQITVRTTADNKIAKGMSPISIVSYDPAFDYICYIKNRLNSPQESLKTIIETNKTIWVINLRPLWSRYSDTNNDLQEEILDVVAELIANNKEGKRFVFMPMNSDQFGFSDLEMAYMLLLKVRKLSPDADFVVWETEPTIDSCILLLQRASLTISMRFHGCVFSLEAGCKTIGLDYSTRSKGKITSLFEQKGIADYSISIKAITTDKLTKAIDSYFQ